MNDRNQEPRGFAARPLAFVIAGLVAFLGTAFIVLYVKFGVGTVLGETPWYVPMMHSLTGFTAFCVGFLALGRYRVLSDKASLLIGSGFAAFGILSVFFILVWPGLGSDAHGVISRLPGTSGWIAVLELSELGVTLFAAALFGKVVPEPQDTGEVRNNLVPVFAFLGLSVLVPALLVRFEAFLPPLADSSGALSPLLLSLDWIFLALFLSGAVLSTYRHLRTGESVLAYTAVTQVTLSFVVVTALIGAKRYDIWYYVSRMVLVGGFLVQLIGYLSEYVALFRREREKTREAMVRLTELTGVLESSPDLIIVTDEKGEVRFASRSARELLHADGEVQGDRLLSDWTSRFELSGADGEPIRKEDYPLSRLFRGERFQGEEIMFFDRTGGSSVWVLLSGVPLLGVHGGRLGGLLVGSDISERRRIEQALELSEEQFRTIVENAPIPVMVVAEDGEILIVSASLLSRTGYARAELIRFSDWIGKAYRGLPQAAVLDDLSLLFSGTVPVLTRERQVTLADGETRTWLVTKGKPGLRRDGRRFITTMAFDVTERKLTEDALRTARLKAEDASRAKSVFLSTMSHELRTPLTGIIGMIELTAAKTTDSRLSMFLSHALNAARTLTGILGEILELSRIESGESGFTPEEFSVRELTAALEERFSRQAAEKQLTFSTRVRGDVPDRVLGHREQLSKVLENLLENAVANTDAGEIYLEASLEHDGWATPFDSPEKERSSQPERAVSGTMETVSVEFRVRDTGRGIPAHKLESVFEPFSNVSGEGVRKAEGGLGVGLAVSRRLVELMGGRIRAESVPEEGSVFSFTVPLKPSGGPVPAFGKSDEEIFRGSSGKRILVVESDGRMREELVEELSVKGYTVRAAGDTRQAVDAVHESVQEGAGLDIVILDMESSREDGVEAVHRLKDAMKAEHPARIIALIPLSMRRQSGTFREHGVSGIAIKPIDFERLDREILRALSV